MSRSKEVANLGQLKQAAHDYFAAVFKLRAELKLSDTPADYAAWKGLSDDLDCVRKIVASANLYLEEVEIQVRLQSHVNYHFRARHYVVRRKAEAVGTELTWAELRELSTDGPWHAGQMNSLDLCRAQRDRQNAIENSDRPNVRGWIKGAYVWETWTYDPADDSWIKQD